ncbi:MAG TPA: class I SAM-dependent methyltransferase, partial [Vicinamibacterales bacterium]|nr:class I SAM-dependent methyltransferase [Vicinamibacterales bacterium]
EAMARYMSSRGAVLDAGCGGGYSASLWMRAGWDGPMWIGADISRAVDVATRTLAGLPNTHYVQADVLSLPFAPASFDVVFSEGVLHHTPSTRAAFLSIASVLKPQGELMAYIYRRKGPVREFTDDHVRAAISAMEPEEAWRALRPLTALAKSLSELNATVDVPEPIPFLGIPAGRHDVQRLIYWYFAKLFWNKQLSFEENNHVNFDWYHPVYAHRHTEAELRGWCAEAGLDIRHLDIQDSGMTVRAVKA